jgi:membrane protease YdiL (CAAX protease family)
MINIQEVAAKHLLVLVLALLITLGITLMAWFRGYYKLPPLEASLRRNIGVREVLGAFAVFLLIELFLMPFLAVIWMKGDLAALKEDQNLYGWWNLASIVISALGIVAYTFFIFPAKRRALFWGVGFPITWERAFKDMSYGSASWLLSFPLVVTVSQIISIAMLVFGPFEHIDQVAVKNVKMTTENPALFWSTILSIIFIVPIAEEILFRGFLQSWYVQLLGRFGGIVVASLLFASFHFSGSQGWNNVELLLSLFILSCYIGFIYERQQSIWAPIALHATFNAISIFALFAGE